VDWIYKTFGETEITAIITGWHQDNLGGNEYLRSLGIDVHGPELTARLINQHGTDLKSMLLESTKDLDDCRYYKSYKNLILTPPNKIFNIEEGLSLTIGEEKFEVYFPGESHTIDNTVVYIHSRKILFGGCMVFSANRQAPGFIEHANMVDWAGSVEKVAMRFPDADVVVPGHGSAGDLSLLNHTIEVLNRFNESNPE
jgi:metallo-beta-lactamase class B